MHKGTFKLLDNSFIPLSGSCLYKLGLTLSHFLNYHRDLNNLASVNVNNDGVAFRWISKE